MTPAVDRLVQSLSRIRDVADAMDLRLLGPQPQRLRDETLRCSCTVILSGFLESFIRELSEAYISTLCSLRVPFSQLPRKLQVHHFVQGGAILGAKTRDQSRVSWVAADHLDIARRLASPASRPESYALLWEAYANTRGNPGPDVIESVLKSLGVDKCRTRLNAELVGGYQPKRLAMESFIAVRNECAHTGTALQVPTTANIRSYCDLIEEVARSMVAVLQKRLTEAPFVFDLNTATEAQLRRVPGIGNARVQALLAYRANAGAITSVQELHNIPGFGHRLVEAIRARSYV